MGQSEEPFEFGYLQTQQGKRLKRLTYQMKLPHRRKLTHMMRLLKNTRLPRKIKVPHKMKKPENEYEAASLPHMIDLNQMISPPN